MGRTAGEYSCNDVISNQLYNVSNGIWLMHRTTSLLTQTYTLSGLINSSYLLCSEA